MNTSPQFWDRMIVLGPVGCFLIPLVGGNLLGIFDHFRWVGQDVSPLQGFTILAIMCFPFAAWFYAMVRRDVALARTSQAWPSVSGVLDEWKAERRFAQSGSLYMVAVKYSYEVAGRKYSGDRLAFASSRIDAGDLYDQLRWKYRPKAAVTVHYDPADPANAVLETDDALARQRMWRVWMLSGVPLLALMFLAFRAAS